MNHGVNVVVALQSEARPLIDHFDLKNKLPSSRVWTGENRSIKLAVSGMGKSAAARAVETLNCLCPNQVSAWFNVGVVGHQSLDIGEGYLVSCVKDQATNGTWYPMFVFEHNCSTGTISTVDQVETEYAESTGYDMEASGFMSSAFRLATAEMVHCYKIVSDNSPSTLSQLTQRRISELVGTHVQIVDRIINSLDDLAAEVAARKFTELILQPFLESWRFSVTQQHMLRNLLRKTSVLGYRINVDSDVVKDCQNAKEVIRKISGVFDSYWSDQQHSNV